MLGWRVVRNTSVMIGALAAVMAGVTPAFALPAVDVKVRGTVAGVPVHAGVTTPNDGPCDQLDPSVCLYPWPNDRFTVADSSTDTGRRLNLELDAMPRNIAGKPIDPTDMNRSDGFSPGNPVITRVPGLDTQDAFRASGLVPITDIDRYADPQQAAVVIDAQTGERHPIWAELDVNPAGDSDRALIVRPARNFAEGRRYIVALRNLKRSDGSVIAPGPLFRAYRDGTPTGSPRLEARRAHMEGLFARLAAAGVPRGDLYLAWDFTVASERGLTERARSIRDDAFAQLGDTDLADGAVQGESPEVFVNPDLPDDLPDAGDALPDVPDGPLPVDPHDVLDFADLREADGVRDFRPCGTDGCQEGEHDRVARRVVGQVVVPCYLNAPGCPPGSHFAFVPGSSEPVRIPGNTTLANFACIIPRRALDGASPQRVKPSLYGHGLLGNASEINAGNIGSMAQEHGFLFCATDWVGMSTTDLPNVGALLVDLSRFNSLADRAQQGFVHFMYLGRAMLHPEGFSKLAAFQTAAGSSVIDTRELFYDGNSQGGIMGGALTALAPDFTNAVLGVPGMNYSTLLRRSVDFDRYSEVLYRAYPDELERPLILSLMQLLWDRGEGNGYAHHMTTDPLPGTPPHRVLLHVAYGDHQVTNFAADVQARTIGAAAHRPLLAPFRPGYYAWGVPAVPAYPHSGSATVYWDTGPQTFPGGVGDNPVDELPNRAGRDPHSAPRSDPDGRRQKARFLADGQLIDVCAGGPCYAGAYTGP